MDDLESFLNAVSGIIWGPVMLVFLLGAGVYLTVDLRAMPWRKIGYAFVQLREGRRLKGEGDITPFQALMTGLSATRDYFSDENPK